MTLRAYQDDAIKRARACFGQGARSVLLVSPTGSGKTVILAAIAKGVVDNGGSVTVLVHRRELVAQTVRKLLAVGARANVVTVQSAQVPRSTFLIADEAHHYVADEWAAVVQRTGAPRMLGVTATPERGDGKGLGAMFERLVVVAQPSALIEAGHLVPCEVVAPADRLKGGQIAQSPVDAYRAHAMGETAVVFSPTVRIAETHLAGFVEAGIPARLVTGAMPKAERDEAFEALRSGAALVLCNVMVATEGLDIPRISTVILARGASTCGTFIQMAGRALRPYPGKERALLLDLVGASHVHGAPDEDRVFSLDGKGIRRSEQDVDVAFCAVCGAVKTGALCTECGHQAEPVTQEVTGERLVKFAKKRAEDDEQRARTLARWLLEGRRKGWKPMAAHFKYRAVYGAMPPPNVQQAAHYLLSLEAA